MRRILVACALVFGIVLMAGNAMDQALLGTSTAQAAPAADVGNFRLSPLTFSSAVSNDFTPTDPQVEFASGTNDVWVTMAYTGYTSGVLSFVARANDSDYSWGKIPGCCPSAERRIGFKIDEKGELRSNQPAVAQPGFLSALSVFAAPARLPGAAYNVIVYLNDEEVGTGGFGVKGGKGLDNDNE